MKYYYLSTVAPYQSTLRARQARQTRELILTCLADLVVEQGTANLSIREVAERAEVSERTVYRHFPTRQDLLDGLARWVRAQITAEGVDESAVTDLEGLRVAIVQTFRSLDRLGPLAEAMVLVSVATESRSTLHEERTQRFRRALEPELRRLGRDPEAVFGVVRHLLSGLTWYVLRTEMGLDGERAGEAVAEVMTAALRPA